MYEIEMHEAAEEFAQCWQAAGNHLQSQVQDGLSWLRAHLSPPFLEHLSFRMGNQLFFVRLEDVDGKLKVPGSREGLLAVADGCKGHACLMPMKKRYFGGAYVPERPGWGLLDVRTGNMVNPIELVTDKKIEMTHWELHDFAVQVVRDDLRKKGYELMSWVGNPEVDPAIWFIGDSKKPEWVVVRAARYPARDAKPPENLKGIIRNCAKLSLIGHFASVAFVSFDQPFEATNETPVKLWRGHGTNINYGGLIPVSGLL